MTMLRLWGFVVGRKSYLVGTSAGNSSKLLSYHQLDDSIEKRLSFQAVGPEGGDGSFEWNPK